MYVQKVSMLGIGLVTALLMLAGCQTALATAPTPSATLQGSSATTSPAGAAGISTPSPVAGGPEAGMMTVPPGASMGEMGRMTGEMSGQIGGQMGGQTSASQMQQTMDQVASLTSQMAKASMQTQQGTPEIRQMMAQTMEQTSALAGQLGDRAQQMTPEERLQAMQDMQGLANGMAQMLSQTSWWQDFTPQTSVAEEQQMMGQIGQMTQMQSTMAKMMSE